MAKKKTVKKTSTKKPAKNRPASDIPMKEFLSVWDGAETRADVKTELNLEGEEGNTIFQAIHTKARNWAVPMKTLQSPRGRMTDTAGRDEAWQIQAELSGKSFDAIKAEAEAIIEERRKANKAKNAVRAYLADDPLAEIGKVVDELVEQGFAVTSKMVNRAILNGNLTNMRKEAATKKNT